MVDTKDLYWAAGILEGEGCFRINNSSGKSYIGVQVRMTDRDVLEHLRDIFGVGQVGNPEYNDNRKPIYTWQVNTQKDSAAVMMTIYPLMHLRRQDRIKECLETWKRTPTLSKNKCRRGHIKHPGKRRCHICDNNSKAERAFEKAIWGD